MAGGMARRGDAPTLAERAVSAAAQPTAPVDVAARRRPVVRRHCWVQGLPDEPGRWPGLLVEWRQAAGDSGWEGRVVYVVVRGTVGHVVVEAWLAAAHLSPA